MRLHDKVVLVTRSTTGVVIHGRDAERGEALVGQWPQRAALAIVDHFASSHGCYPICNGQAGMGYPASSLPKSGIVVAWDEFR